MLGSIRLVDNFRAIGTIALQNCKIGGSLECTSGHIDGGTDDAIDLGRAHVVSVKFALRFPGDRPGKNVGKRDWRNTRLPQRVVPEMRPGSLYRSTARKSGRVFNFSEVDSVHEAST